MNDCGCTALMTPDRDDPQIHWCSRCGACNGRPTKVAPLPYHGEPFGFESEQTEEPFFST